MQKPIVVRRDLSVKDNAINRVQSFMDRKAQEYGYDHILSASSYVTSTFPKFQAEGIAFAKWRDDVWNHCFNVLAEWEAGKSLITTEDELIKSLPEFKVAEKVAIETRDTQKAKDIANLLPAWSTVKSRCEEGRTKLSEATNLAMVKPIVLAMINFMEDMARVIYWLAKNKKE